MNKFVKLCLVTVAVLMWFGHSISGANIPQPPPAPLQAFDNSSTTTTVQLRDVETVKDIRSFIARHPNLNLTRMIKKERAHKSQTMKYTLGNRVAGDRLIAQFGDTSFYPNKQDVTTQVTYPETDTGSAVNAVEIHCLQDENDGNAYVVAGGLGQRFISIVLEATQTQRFTYNIHVYGTD